uniref:Uncharacterized protein LOC105643279 n=1 Tax=Rhizophora mucronata TaxID=61149 RepID=A0A2P2JMF7_RHIMU
MAVSGVAACLLTTVRLELENSSNSKKENGKKGLGNGIGPTKNSTLPPFSVSKPSWVVKTESNVWKETRKKPDPPCVVCKGSGRVACHHCSGTGRTNYTHLAMLPKGKWPKW